jgi:hypothetical protein
MFEQIRDDELKIIKQLYTVHIIYKSTLMKKMNGTVFVDDFILNYLEIGTNPA